MNNEPSEPVAAKQEEPRQSVDHVEDIIYTSRKFHVTVRGALAIVIILVICIMQLRNTEIKEPLRDMGIFIMGYFFRQFTPPSKK